MKSNCQSLYYIVFANTQICSSPLTQSLVQENPDDGFPTAGPTLPVGAVHLGEACPALETGKQRKQKPCHCLLSSTPVLMENASGAKRSHFYTSIQLGTRLRKVGKSDQRNTKPHSEQVTVTSLSVPLRQEQMAKWELTEEQVLTGP